MQLLTNFRLLLNDLWAQKLRTFLTIFGIMWGTMSVILLLSFGAGVHKQNIKNANGIGEGVVIVWGGKTGKSFNGFNKGRDIRLQAEDTELLRREIPSIQWISPEYSTYGADVRGPLNVDQTNITGIIPEYEDIRNVFPEPGGRFINELDIDQNRRVAFLGNKLRDFLYGENKDVIGQMVHINEIPFTIIGVMQKKIQNSNYNTSDRDRVFIPASTFRSVFGDRYISNMVFKPYSMDVGKSVKDDMYRILGKKYIFDPTDEDALWVWDTAEFFDVFMSFFLGFQIFLGVIGSFTLTVGGVGVANIMYVVVKERTREIGVKRAVGARRRNILFQFIFEAIVIVTVGALIGFLFAAGLVELLQNLPEGAQEAVGKPIFSGNVAIAAVSLLGLVALMAGYFPARRASLVDPIEALRS